MPQGRRESVTATLTPIIATLIKAEDVLGKDRVWQSVNPAQTRFLSDHFSRRDEIAKALSSLSPFEPLQISSIASYQAEEINRFLQDKGFNIHLNPFTTRGEFGTASVMDVLVKWLNPGTSSRLIAADNQNYPAARLKKGVDIERSSAAKNPIAYINTQHPDYRVGLTIPNEPITDAFELTDFVKSIRESQLFPDSNYAGLLYPKVSLDQRVDINWLKGMYTAGDDGLPAIITQALQQTRFRMNEIGARAESAVALGMRRSMAPIEKPLVIDRPFVCWIEKTGVSLPLFAGYINYPDWKDPGSLE